jgi:Flp pilus assembly CpaE family ATPase
LLKTVSVETERVVLLRELDGYPQSIQLLRLLSTIDADVWIIDCLDAERSLDCATHVRLYYPNAAILGIDAHQDQTAGLLELGVHLIPGFPPQPDQHANALDAALRQAKGGSLDNLFAFLPAKAGSGSSTVALNTAAVLVSLKKKVALIEADLRSGVLSLMLNLTPHYGIQQVLEGISDLDNLRWEGWVTRARGIDLLPSNRASRDRLPSWNDYFSLLNFVCPRYDAVLVDLPELVNPATLEVVRRAALVFGVCTPELLSLRLAQERCRDMEAWGLKPERVRLLLNRMQDSELSVKDVEKHVGQRVSHAFPNDYRAVRAAVLKGEPVDPATKLGQSYVAFASQMVGLSAPAAPSWLGGRLRGLLR